jgi:hypothetical protein
MIITEKIDGTNAQLNIASTPYEDFFEGGLWSIAGEQDGWQYLHHPQAGYVITDTDQNMMIRIGSRNRWINPDAIAGKGSDNFGFAHWAWTNITELSKLGVGRHYGEWYGRGVQKCYPSVTTKAWALFEHQRHIGAYIAMKEGHETAFPSVCELVPLLFKGGYDTNIIELTMASLQETGSLLCNGDAAEGVVVDIPHTDFKQKLTFNYSEGKWKEAA